MTFSALTHSTAIGPYLDKHADVPPKRTVTLQSPITCLLPLNSSPVPLTTSEQRLGYKYAPPRLDRVQGLVPYSSCRSSKYASRSL